MRKYTVFIAIIALLVMTGGMLYGYFRYIPERIEKTVLSSIYNLGFEYVEIGSIERKRGLISFKNISLGEDGFSTIKALHVRFSPLNTLFSPDRASKISIHGLTLTGEYKDTISLSGWNNKLFQRFLNAPTNSFPARLITIEDSRLDLLSDGLGGVGISYNGQMRLDGEKISIRGEAKSKQRKISYQAKIDGSIQPDGVIKVNAETAQISFDHHNIKVRRGASTVRFSYDPAKRSSAISAESHMASVLWHGLPLREVHSVFEIENGNYNLSAEGKTFGNHPIEWNTRVNSVDQMIKSQTTLQPKDIDSLLKFLKANKKLRDDTHLPSYILHVASPALSVNTAYSSKGLKGDFKALLNQPSLEIEGYFTGDADDLGVIDGAFNLPSTAITAGKSKGDKTQFHISASGEFAIAQLTDKALLKWKISNQIEGGVLDYGPVKLQGFKGKVSLGSDKDGKRRERLSFRLPLKPHIKQRGTITMNIKDRDAALFEQIIYSIYGGQIRTQNRLFNDGTLSSKNRLIVSDIDLNKLFDDAGFRHVLISGTLGGVVPFQVKNNRIIVNGGLLQSQSSGILQLPEHMIVALFPGNTHKMKTIRAALTNYYYEFFEIRLDGDLSGRVLMTLKASGFNPKFKDRDPVDLSLQIETQISILFKNLLK